MSADESQPTGQFQLLTSPGPAAIAVIRVRGPATDIFLEHHVRAHTRSARSTWPAGRVLRAALLERPDCELDDMLVSVHAPGPGWDVRLHLHGSPWLVQRCIEMLKETGLTDRAESASTLWHTDNLIEAEADAMLPRMLTLSGVHWLLRQKRLLNTTVRTLADEADVDTAQRRCREIATRRGVFDWFARPLRIALIGPPNAGKSTLANALADQHASLVSPQPGTTRDWVEIPGEMDGFPVTWLDTAGLRRGGDALEAEAARRTRLLMEAADAILLVLDASGPATRDRREFIHAHADLAPACIALNKSDLVDANAAAGVHAALPAGWRNAAVPVSARRRTGFEALGARLLETVGYGTTHLVAPAAFTERQVQALEAAAAAERSRFRPLALRCLGRLPSR